MVSSRPCCHSSAFYTIWSKKECGFLFLGELWLSGFYVRHLFKNYLEMAEYFSINGN